MQDKCTRCNRNLKNPQLIDGAPYGPVCFVKMGGVRVRPERPHVEKVLVEHDPSQLSFFQANPGER